MNISPRKATSVVSGPAHTSL